MTAIQAAIDWVSILTSVVGAIVASSAFTALANYLFRHRVGGKATFTRTVDTNWAGQDQSPALL